MTVLTTADLTAATTAGAGVFDVLMRAVKSHLDLEFAQGRIKGPEYSTVYLGSVNLAMQTGLSFLLQRDKNDLEVQLLNAQIELANVGVLKAQAELAIIQATQLKIPAEIAQIQAQTALTGQQQANLVAEALNIPKQGLLLDAQVLVAQKQVSIADAEILIKQQQLLISQAEVDIAVAKLVNIPKEGAQLDAQTLLTGQQRLNMVSEELGIDARTALTSQQNLNSVIEGTVLVAQECKLRSEFDLTQAQTLRSTEERALLTQKVATEKAQTAAIGVDDNSVIGKQKLLYAAQTSGFTRDAEQKAAKLMADTWSVRRTTDEATVADGVNLLNDVTVGRTITKLLAGVGA